MERKASDKSARWLCAVLFSAFAFSWFCFFQKDLLCAAYNKLLYGIESPEDLLTHNHIAVSLLLTLFALLLVFPGRFLLRFKRGLYACNYILAAAFLGVITGYDGSSILGQSYTDWMVTGVFAVVLLLICKVVSSIPRSEYNDRPRTVAGNLVIMSLLFCMTAYLGNTDENLHRRLCMERLYAASDYAALLDVGRYEEESDRDIDLLRAKAMLNLPSDSNPDGSSIGEQLFNYSISDPQSLSISLKEMENEQAYLVSCLLDGNLSAFSDTIDLGAYNTLPKYYMQALLIAGDSIVPTRFPQQYAQEKSTYDSFCESLALLELEPKQYQSNATFIKYHESYFWYYTFKR